MNYDTLNHIDKLLGKIATIAMLIPIIIAFVKYLYLNKALKIMLWFCLMRFLVSLINVFIIWLVNSYKLFFEPILNKLDIHNMNFISILAFLNNFGFLGWYFYIVINKSKYADIVRILSIFLFTTALVNYFFIEGYKIPSIYNSTMSSIFCFTLPLIHLWFIFNENTKVLINKNPYFWLALGLFIPNLLIFIFALAGKKMNLTDNLLYLKVDIVSSIVQIIGFILVAIGFYYAHYTKYLPQQSRS